MTVRPIDAEKYMELLKEQYLHHKSMGNGQAAKAWQGAMQLLHDMPTLTQPNEWVKVMEAINNAAVAYIEGGPYENDLPGMEFALKIDRLSRDFVRPPEGEEDT